MPIENLYNAFAPRQKSVADYDADALRAREGNMALQQNALALQTSQMQLQDRQRALAEQDQVRSALLKANPDVASRIGALEGTGLQSGYDMADKLRKATADQEKTAAETGLKKVDTERVSLDNKIKATEFMARSLGEVKNPTQLAQWYQSGIEQGLIKSDKAQAEFARIPLDNPQEMQRWIAQKQSEGVSVIEKMKLKQQQDQLAETARHNKSNEGIQIRGQNMTDARSREANAATLSKPFETTGPDGVPVLVQMSKDGKTIVPVQGFQPKGMGATKLTEDQGKATGWLSQATNAYSNMQAALQSTPGAAKPGVNDAIARLPLVGEGLANSMRSDDRQKYLQASSSLSEALLRAATGAGVNKDEAIQKVRELTPQFGEGDQVIKQKMDAIPVYLESLKVRAGPGAKQLPDIMDRARATQPNAGAFSDADKERRYQEWKARQGK